MQYSLKITKPTRIICLKILFIISIVAFQSLETFSQTGKVDTRINVSITDSPLKELMSVIEKESGLHFFYDAYDVDVQKKITVNYVETSIRQILKNQPGGYSYEIKGNQIIVKSQSKGKQQVRKKYTISGYLRDNQTTESLIGATVYNKFNMAGTTTNQYGFYSLTLPEGEIDLIFSYVGYEQESRKFYLTRDTLINIALSGSVYLQDVEITGSRSERIQERTQMSAINVPVAQIKSLPALLGETDILKTLQLMPGIQSGNEGNSGLYVRGGGPDQNLVLLDGVPVYNASHLLGFFSVFNADAVNNIEVFKGGFPARYGGRNSSVLDITLKEGNMREFHGEGAIGIISSKFTFEGPIWKDRTSFIISGRRTYLDLLAKPAIAIINARDDYTKIDLGYYFYDLTAKVNHKFSANDRIYLSAYMGDDAFKSDEKYEKDEAVNYEYDKDTRTLQWGNITTAFRWNHIFSNKLFSNTTLMFSRYRFLNEMNSWKTRTYRDFATEPPVIEGIDNYYGSRYVSGIRDWSGKIVFDYIPSPNHYIRMGADVTYHTFNPGVMATKSDTSSLDVGAKRLHSFEYSAYVEDDIKLTGKLKANIGLHWSGFDVGKKFYQVLQPRVSLRYLLADDLSLKASYSLMAQYVHLLTTSTIGLPMDLWVPSTGILKPQRSSQFVLGLAKNLKEEYEITLEGYYKTMNNVLEYKEGVTFFDVGDRWEENILQGEGRSYGMEVFAQKKTGVFTGWIGYTLSWTDRKFDELNDGKRFYYKYDRRHDVSIALIYHPNEKIEVSGTWVLGSGTWTTVPIGVYYLYNPIIEPEGDYVPDGYRKHEYIDYDKRNGYRMDAHHRLDLGVSFIKKKKWGERRWIISLYNAYNRKNPFYIDIKKDYDPQHGDITKYTQIQYSLFPIIPSITYQFKF